MILNPKTNSAGDDAAKRSREKYSFCGPRGVETVAGVDLVRSHRSQALLRLVSSNGCVCSVGCRFVAGGIDMGRRGRPCWHSQSAHTMSTQMVTRASDGVCDSGNVAEPPVAKSLDELARVPPRLRTSLGPRALFSNSGQSCVRTYAAGVGPEEARGYASTIGTIRVLLAAAIPLQELGAPSRRLAQVSRLCVFGARTSIERHGGLAARRVSKRDWRCWLDPGKLGLR